MKTKNILLYLMIPLLLGSCSAFKSTTEMDMEPFSDNAGILFNEAVKVSRPFQFKNLALYADTEQYTAIKSKSVPLINALKGIVYYSNQLVAIQNSHLSERQKNQQLAIYLEDVFSKTTVRMKLDSIGLSADDVNRTLSNIRVKETYLEAIAEADPIINTIVLALFDKLDVIEDDVSKVIASFEDELSKDYQYTIDNYLRIKSLENATHESLSLLYKYWTKDKSLKQDLLDSDKSLQNLIGNKETIGLKEYHLMEDYLFQRMENIEVMLRQLDDDKSEYLSKKEEISNWHLQVDEKLSIARNAIIIWAQSHRNLGKGIKVPPLLDITTLLGLVEPSLKKVATTVVPI